MLNQIQLEGYCTQETDSENEGYDNFFETNWIVTKDIGHYWPACNEELKQLQRRYKRRKKKHISLKKV